MIRKLFEILAGLCLVLSLCACGAKPPREGAPDAAEASGGDLAAESAETRPAADASAEEGSAVLRMTIGETAVAVDWEENESAEALRALCRSGPLTVSLSRYGGFEQVGSLGASLPRNDVQTTTGPGDIVLYSGDQLVVFYGTNTWAYTRLGRVRDQSAADMAALLGGGDVTITLWLEAAG